MLDSAGFLALLLDRRDFLRHVQMAPVQRLLQRLKRGTHLLLQTRVKTLNGELGSVFEQWAPALQLEKQPQAA